MYLLFLPYSICRKEIFSSASQLPLLALKIKPNSVSPTNAQQVKRIKIWQSHLIRYHLIYHFKKKPSKQKNPKKPKTKVDMFMFLKTLNHSPILCFTFLIFRNLRNCTLGALKKMYIL